MTDLHLSCFLSTDRPKIQDLAVTVLPADALGPQLASQLLVSLKVNTNDGPRCAASARLWEQLLEQYRLPYLLLRVADMRANLGSKITALTLYEELQDILQVPQLGEWIDRFRALVNKELQDRARFYLVGLDYAPSQRWRPTASVDPFPYSRLQRAKIDDMRQQWRDMRQSLPDTLDKYLNFHCLESTTIEGVAHFVPSAANSLLSKGFYGKNLIISDQDIMSGEIRDPADVLSILRDTHEAVKEAFSHFTNLTAPLTVDLICRLHKILMRTCHISSTKYLSAMGVHRLSHYNIGVTRQTLRVDVTATMASSGKKVQFCPYGQVDRELGVFCERFNELVQKDDVDPFAASAWITHVFIAVHPFEDGNGRLSRILSSIPLLRKGLPPLCIMAKSKQVYIQALTQLRANRDGDYSLPMKEFYDNTKLALLEVKKAVGMESSMVTALVPG